MIESRTGTFDDWLQPQLEATAMNRVMLAKIQQELEDETTLMIGSDDECVWETTLYKGMEPTTFTVPLGEDCERLMFWLDCGPEDNGSHTYAIYDITLNK